MLLSLSNKPTAGVLEYDKLTALLDSFALHAPSHRIWLEDSGLAEKDVLCEIMTIAPSYRGARRTLRSRCLRALKDEVEKKLKLPHAAARAKDRGAKHIIFAMSSNGAFSKPARGFFNNVKQHVQEHGRTHMGISFRDTHSNKLQHSLLGLGLLLASASLLSPAFCFKWKECTFCTQGIWATRL